MTLRYRVPKDLHLGFLGGGIGPYAYTFTGGGADTRTVAPVATLYAGYFITEAMRVVAFDAITVHKDHVNDLGLYLVSEQFKTLDRRISLNVMLGAHVVGLNFNGSGHIIFSAPQGAEITFRDLFKKSYNFSFGSFVYPPIDGTAYYNVWLRWGKPTFFYELNYISWREQIDGQNFYARAFGVCVGFPLWRFL
jgi:hypothetical protein